MNWHCLQKIGCDSIVGSKSEADVCQVCEGDGSTCTKEQGETVIKVNQLGQKQAHTRIKIHAQLHNHYVFLTRNYVIPSKLVKSQIISSNAERY